jgi:hypothetical protein
MTVTGATLGENLDRWTHKYGELSETQDVIRPLSKPIKETGHLRFVNVLSVSLKACLPAQDSQGQPCARRRGCQDHGEGGPVL